MNSKSDEISKSINAKIELSIAIEELSQISERFLSSIHVVQNNSFGKIIPLEDAVEKARNLVAILKDIFEPRIVIKKEPKLKSSKSPFKKKSKQSLSNHLYGQHISDVVTETENQLELITGFREGSICMIVNKIHRFGMKDTSRYPFIKWDCFKRKDDGCSAGFSTKIINVEEVDKLCQGQEKREKAKCLGAVHTLTTYKHLNNHSDHIVEPSSSKSGLSITKSPKKKKLDTNNVKIEEDVSDDNMDMIHESDVIMIDGYDPLESYTKVQGCKDHDLKLIPGKAKGSISMLVDKTHRFSQKDSSSYPLIKWACAKRKSCECKAAFSTRIVNAEVVDQVFFNEPSSVKSKCVQAIHKLEGFNSINNHSSHSVAQVSKTEDSNGSQNAITGNGGQFSTKAECISDTTDDEDDTLDTVLDAVVENEAAAAPAHQSLSITAVPPRPQTTTVDTSEVEKSNYGLCKFEGINN